MTKLRGAIGLCPEGLIEEGGAIPPAAPTETMRAHHGYADGTWAIVNLDESTRAWR